MSAEPSRLAVVAALSIALATPPSLTRASTSMISWPPPPSLRTQRDATEKAQDLAFSVAVGLHGGVVGLEPRSPRLLR